jgi:hypothetical protein
MQLEFSRYIFEKKNNSHLSDLVKIRLVEAELFHVDRQTDDQTEITKLIVAYRDSSNASKIGSWSVKAISLLW